MPHLRVKNSDLFYETCGAGEPLVLIPGFASGAWIWFKQIPELSGQFRIVTFDPRGVSRSPIFDGVSVSLQTIAADIVCLLDELQIEKANILGASFGGFIAQEFAISFPERLNKLILACTSFGGKNHVAPELEVLLAFASTENLNSAERICKFIAPAFTPEFAEKHADEVEKVCRLREQNRVPENVYLAQLQAATTFDAEARAPEIRAETLVLTGDRDIVVPPQNSENLTRAIPNAELQVVRGGSHMFFIEKADEFNRAVEDFLKKV